MELGFIGVAHIDPDGEERLARVLEGVEPEVICVERTQEDFARNVQAFKMFQLPEDIDSAVKTAMSKLPGSNEETLRRLIASSFYTERAVLNYALAAKRRIVFCEEDLLEREKLAERAEEDIERDIIVSFENRAGITVVQLAEEVDFEYRRNEYSVKKIPELVINYSERDVIAERIIRAQEGKVLYVGSLDRIYGNYSPNLFDRLSDIFPERKKLCEF